MRIWRRTFALLLAFCLVVGCLPLTVGAEQGPSEEKEKFRYDSLTDTLRYELWGIQYDYQTTLSNGTINHETRYKDVDLYILGTGDMPDYKKWTSQMSPWCPDSSYYDNITSITIDEGVTSIGDYAFAHCKDVTGITIPDSVTRIGDSVFYECAALTSVTLGSGVVSIGADAFYGRNLTQINLPDSLETIGGSAFAGTPLNTVVIPEKVTSIGARAFRGCTNLTDIVIPNAVETIGSGAFLNCSNLASVTIGSGVKTIGDFAFSETALTEVTIPEGVTELGGAFADCAALTKVSIPASAATIGESAFENCSALREVTIAQGDGETPLDIGEAAFKNCAALGPVEIPARTTGIGNYAFYGCWAFTSNLVIPNGVTTLGEYAFQESGITSVSIPSSVKEIGRNAFYNCANLLDVDIHSGVEAIRIDAFRTSSKFVSQLRSLKIPSSVKQIGTFTGNYQGPNIFSAGSTLHVFYEGTEEQWKKFASDDITPGRYKEITYNYDGIITDPPIGGEPGPGPDEPSKPERLITTARLKIGDKKSEKLVEVTWDDRMFYEDATIYSHDLARVGIVLSNAAYNAVSSLDDPEFKATGFPKDCANVYYALKKLKFDNITPKMYDYHKTKDDCDIVAYTFATKQIPLENKTTVPLVTIVVRGTDAEEWYSDFDIGYDQEYAKGFKLPYEQLMKELDVYLAEHGLNKKQCKFFVTGHSRGAAVANLVAAKLNEDGPGKTAVYAYTFAAPNVYKHARRTDYENIFNIINPEDMVPRMPLTKGWGFKRFGTNLKLPTQSTYGKDYEPLFNMVDQRLYELTDHHYHPYRTTYPVDSALDEFYRLAPTTRLYYTKEHKSSSFQWATTHDFAESLCDVLVKGIFSAGPMLSALWKYDFKYVSRFFTFYGMNEFAHAHDSATYYCWMEKFDAGDLFSDTPKDFKRVTIACPVDVEIADAQGNVVVSIVNEQIVKNDLAISLESDEYNENTGELVVDSATGGIKVIDLPSDQQYSIKIVARNNGKVEYKVEEIEASTNDGDDDVVQRTVAFTSIPIQKDNVITGKVDQAQKTAVTNYNLTLKAAEDSTESKTISAAQDVAGPITPDDPKPDDPKPDDPKPDDPKPDDPKPDNRPSGPNGPTIAFYSIKAGQTEHGSIRLNPSSVYAGGTVTVAVKPDKGYKLEKLTVTDSQGKTIETAAGKNGNYTFKMPGSNVTVNAEFVPEQTAAPTPEPTGKPSPTPVPDPDPSPSPWQNPFPDVSDTAWYTKAVEYVAAEGLMNGYANGRFGPNDNISRAEFAQIIYNKAGRPKAGSGVFTDVKAEDWYANAVTWAVEQKVVTGIGNNQFAPNRDITREELATMLWRYAGSPEPAKAALRFTDAGKVSAFAKEAMLWANERGIISGKGNDILDPKGKATRAEAAQMLMNYLKE